MLITVFMSLAWAKDTPLVIATQDAEGATLTNGHVYFQLEGDIHRVNHQTGTATFTTLYRSDGQCIMTSPGTIVRFDVWAPGYIPVTKTVTISKKKGEYVTVSLEAMDLEKVTPGAEATLQAAQTWVDTPRDGPDLEAQQAAYEAARSSLEEATRAWIASGTSDPRALQLCLSSSYDRDTCTSPAE